MLGLEVGFSLGGSAPLRRFQRADFLCAWEVRVRVVLGVCDWEAMAAREVLKVGLCCCGGGSAGSEGAAWGSA